MLIRYSKNKNGKRVEVARIYTVQEHGIKRSSIDRGALYITRTLQRNGYEAYIVGGAVRDLLLGKVPKDFDIATDALPRRIKKIFRNAHVIGKRFRLVHVPVGDGVVEVSTFRSHAPSTNSNDKTTKETDLQKDDSIYGTLEEDVRRRDFSFNALYYSPANETIIDFVGGVEDIKAKRIRCLIPRKEIFRDDPVRIIRAIKYASMGGFAMPFLLRYQISKDAPLIKGCSHSRLTEEVFKILKCGSSASIMRNTKKLKVLVYLLPEIDARLDNPDTLEKFFASLEALDQLTASLKEVKKGVMIKHLVSPFIAMPSACENPLELHRELFTEIKHLVHPITPPNHDVEEAVRMMMKEAGFRPIRSLPQQNRRGSLQRKGVPSVSSMKNQKQDETLPVPQEKPND